MYRPSNIQSIVSDRTPCTLWTNKIKRFETDGIDEATRKEIRKKSAQKRIPKNCM